MYSRVGLFEQANDIELQIKQTFYNGLGEYVLTQDNVTPENLNQKLLEGVVQSIRNVLALSKGKEGMHLPTGGVVTAANCPLAYQGLFAMLLQLKDMPVVNQDHIVALANQMMRFDAFRESDPRQFLLEALGFADAPQIKLFDESDVTPDLIRETFYNEMVRQGITAVENEWLTLDDLRDAESKIFFALPALTLLEAAQQSRQHPHAIRLLNDKMLTKASCPNTDNFPMLLDMMLALKQELASLSNNQLEIIKHNLATEADKALPVTPVLSNLIGRINAIAIPISQSAFFHKMVTDVIARCCEILIPPPAPKW